jgi:hypothetical protein
MARDVRELTDSPEAYAAELRQRWGGLLSYRYIGRSYASMDLGPEDNTVTRATTCATRPAVSCLPCWVSPRPHVMFVARGKVGPFRVEAEPMAGADGTVAVRTVTHDEGADGRVTTVGSYLFHAEIRPPL